MAAPHRSSPLTTFLLVVVCPAGLLVAYFTVPMGSFGPDHPLLSWTVFGLFLTGLAVLLERQVVAILRQTGRGTPALTILAASILALVTFASAYVALARQPGEFSGLHTRLDSLYFTVVTMATVGYGDIVPTGQSSRLVVVVQIAYTLVFLAAGFTAFGQQVRGRIGGDRQHRG
jgi:voltage-gated potassium channel Kch